MTKGKKQQKRLGYVLEMLNIKKEKKSTNNCKFKKKKCILASYQEKYKFDQTNSEKKS